MVEQIFDGQQADAGQLFGALRPDARQVSQRRLQPAAVRRWIATGVSVA
jgi:hypothetical protein